MNIRKKLIISNVIMAVLPILTAVLLCGIILVSGGGYYLRTIENMFEDDNGLNNIQGIMYQNRDKMLEYGEELLEEGMDELDYDDRSEAFSAFEREMNLLGYHYEITINSELILTTLGKEDFATITELVQGNYDTIETISVSGANGAVVKKTFRDKNLVLEVLAVTLESGVSISQNRSIIFQYFATILLLFSVVVIVSIILTNIILSRWISVSILKPLMQLTEGSRQITEGNLEYRTTYQKDNEIGKVCKEFNTMASYLQNVVLERTQYEEERRQILSGISHDLRTPLTSIRGYVEGLIDGLANTPDKQSRYYRAIETRTKDLEVLVENLSKLSKYEDISMNFNLEPFCLNHYVSNYVKEHQEEYGRQGLQLRYMEDCQEELWICGNRDELKRVCNNLIENSRKYAGNSQCEVEIQLSRQGDQVIWSFRDNGVGVEEQELGKIFHTFYRGDSARTNPGKGQGLGLSIVQHIIEKHNGTIEAKNDNGLVITICLPLGQ